MTLGGTWEDHMRILGTEPVSAACKAMALPAVLAIALLPIEIIPNLGPER